MPALPGTEAFALEFFWHLNEVQSQLCCPWSGSLAVLTDKTPVDPGLILECLVLGLGLEGSVLGNVGCLQYRISE